MPYYRTTNEIKTAWLKDCDADTAVGKLWDKIARKYGGKKALPMFRSFGGSRQMTAIWVPAVVQGSTETIPDIKEESQFKKPKPHTSTINGKRVPGGMYAFRARSKIEAEAEAAGKEVRVSNLYTRLNFDPIRNVSANPFGSGLVFSGLSIVYDKPSDTLYFECTKAFKFKAGTVERVSDLECEHLFKDDK
jgi:hypothetical protein